MKQNKNYFVKIENRKLNEKTKIQDTITIKTTFDLIKTIQFLMRLLEADVMVEKCGLFEEIYEKCKS